jgi:hypothetical protein
MGAFDARVQRLTVDALAGGAVAVELAVELAVRWRCAGGALAVRWRCAGGALAVELRERGVFPI